MKLIIFSLLGAMLSFQVSASDFKLMVSDQDVIAHGKEIYQQRCSGCHGDKGDGLGPAAVFLDPKPRDFTKGIFKFKSTPIDALPTDHDLLKVIEKGIYGTSMPSFPLLSEFTKFALVQYVKTFSKVWEQADLRQNPVTGAPLPLADFSHYDSFIKRAEKGKKIFADNCVICHGTRGLGDGEGGLDLTDDWGFIVKPGNLRNLSIKSGRDVNEIYRTLLVGIAGTPMPPFKEVVSDEELWDVTAYVMYLRGEQANWFQEIQPLKEIEL